MDSRRQEMERIDGAGTRRPGSVRRGHLKIFFGYAEGVGKSYAMLKAAHMAKGRGVDVVAGYIAAPGRAKIAALLSGLERISARPVEGGLEFDLDEALQRKPGLLLVDDLAHRNVRGCRHARRYQDVEELLRAGIDVYTTASVQNIESLSDTVAAITGLSTSERIPDSVFNGADQVELVDIEPAELLERARAGDLRDARVATPEYFNLETLTALRELAMRCCADRVNMLADKARAGAKAAYHTDEHILVCLSSAPSNAKIVRTAARMANAFKGRFTALFVETPGFEAMDDADKDRLRSNMRLAEQLGATIETVYGEDVSYQIAEFARLSNVSQIVIGRSAVGRRRLLGKPTLTEQLTSLAPNLDVHIIPDMTAKTRYYGWIRDREAWILTLRDLLVSILLLIAATFVGFAFSLLGFSEANVVTVYILAVLAISAISSSRVCSLIASIVSVLVFNFFFTVPKFTFHAYDRDYPVTFVTMFIAALLTGTLASRLKRHARQSAQAAVRTKVLFETNQLLQKAETDEEIITATAHQLIKLLGRTVVVYPAEGEDMGEPHVYRVPETAESGKREFAAARQGKLPGAAGDLRGRGADTGGDTDVISEKERTVAHWVWVNNKQAGATTDTFSDAICRYLAVRVNDAVYGVVGIVMDGRPLDTFENSVVLSILGECALAMESKKNAAEKEQAAILAKNEQLRANLLRSISHDLRTPLTSISGNASNLISNSAEFDEETKQRIYTDIYDDSMWLINLVENLLSVTRIEQGQMNIRQSTELMDEVVTEALRHVNRQASEHTITVENGDDMILVKIDARLIVQVIINIVDNAIKYTQPGSHITLTTKKQGDMVAVSIADDGPGIPDAQKPHIFDMFFSGANKIVDSRRSLGLGLSLCKSIITAHGGEISVADNKPRGTVFTFTLPSGEVEIHE